MCLVKKRGIGKTICPSEAARLVSPDDWRSQMAAVRSAACRLAAQGLIVVTQRGEVVDAVTAEGPIRIALSNPTAATDRSPQTKLNR